MVDEVNAHILEELDKTTFVTYHNVDEIDANTPDDKTIWPLGFLHRPACRRMP